MKCITLTLLAALLLAVPTKSSAEHEGKVQILLLGDSTAEGSIPRKLMSQGPHLEDVIQLLLAAEGDLPPCRVTNLGLSGEFIRRLLDSGRYDNLASKLPGLDYILIRYGLNDVARREQFDANFPKDFHELISRLCKDHPSATIIPMTVIPMAFKLEGDDASSKRINDLVRQVASDKNLTLFDIYPRYHNELAQGQDEGEGMN